MRKIYINENWTFCDIVKRIEDIKLKYESILSSFSILQLHDKVLFMRDLRNKIYLLKTPERNRDRLWNYLNGFEYLSMLKSIAEREK